MKKIFAITLALVMVVAIFAACGQQQTAPAVPAPAAAAQPGDAPAPAERPMGDPIRIGLTTPVTGPQAAGGLMARNGSELRISEINEAGGINIGGVYHLLELMIEDDQAQADVAMNTVRRLVSDDAVAILGPWFSGQVLAIADTITELEVPIINSATSVRIAELENPWLWRARCDDGINVQIIARAIADSGATNVGIMAVNDEVGTAAAEGYMEAFAGHGIDFHLEWHTASDTDLTAQISLALAAGVDAWVVHTHDQAAVAFAMGMYGLGLRDQIVYMNPILAQTQVLEMMEPEWVEGWRCVSDFSFTDTRPAQAEFTANFIARFNINPDVQAALYYSHVTILADAIQRAGSTEPRAIRDAIAQTHGLETLVGTAFAADYTNLIWEIGINEIQDLTPVIVGSVSIAADMGFAS